MIALLLARPLPQWIVDEAAIWAGGLAFALLVYLYNRWNLRREWITERKRQRIAHSDEFYEARREREQRQERALKAIMQARTGGHDHAA